MRIGVPKETWPGELRAALVPAGIKKLIGLGFSVNVEAGLGAGARIRRRVSCGRRHGRGRRPRCLGAEVVVRAADRRRRRRTRKRRHPHQLLDPLTRRRLLVASLASASPVSMEMVPRSARAEDGRCRRRRTSPATSPSFSQRHTSENAADDVTPAGTIQPCRVLGSVVGVAGCRSLRRQSDWVRASKRSTLDQLLHRHSRFRRQIVQIDLGNTGRPSRAMRAN
jgi:NAD(P) transhydrogenase subunit alpha